MALDEPDFEPNRAVEESDKQKKQMALPVQAGRAVLACNE